MDRFTCSACRLSHTVITRYDDGQRLCPMCSIHEQTLQDQINMRGVVRFLKAHKICGYCGEYATDVEHVVARRLRLPTWTIPACSECNGLAGGRTFYGFRDKRDFIRGRLRKKYKKLLARPEWDREEIRAVKGRLREYILASEEQRQVIYQRLQWDWLALLIKPAMMDEPARMVERA